MTKPKTPTKPAKKPTKPTKKPPPSFSFTSTLDVGGEDGANDGDPEPLQTLNIRDGVFRVFKQICVTSGVTMMKALEIELTAFCHKNGHAVPPSRRPQRRRS